MRVGVIGVGYWGPNIVRNLHAIDACDGVVAFDIDDSRLQGIVHHYPATHVARTLEDVLDDPGIAAVVIATPVVTHAELAKRALAAGKSVLVEKPLAVTTRDAREIVGLARERGSLVMAGHTFLFSPPVQAVARLIRAGEIGAPLYVQSSRVNLGIHRSDVDVIWDLAPHDLSILRAWLGADPVRVSALSGSHAGDRADFAFIDLQYESGCLASLHLSWLAPTKVRRMTLVGSRKMVVYEDTNTEEPVRVYESGALPPDPDDLSAPAGGFTWTYRTGDVVAPRLDSWEPLRAELERFLARVAAGETPDEQEEAAIGVVSVIEAAERSVSFGGVPVKVGELVVPLDFGELPTRSGPSPRP
jgi:predicted dehydrogenase